MSDFRNMILQSCWVAFTSFNVSVIMCVRLTQLQIFGTVFWECLIGMCSFLFMFHNAMILKLQIVR